MRRDRFDVGADLLDGGVPRGGEARWANLGDWSAARRYPEAARALALRVGRAAGVGEGARVLDLACGEGASLALWREALGAAAVVGVEVAARRAAVARRVAGAFGEVGGEVVGGDALAALAGPLAKRAFDAVVCVDAAYHLGSLAAFTRACATALAPGGRLAFTTLAWADERPGGLGGVAARVAARLAAVPEGAVVPLGAVGPTLVAAGLGEVRVERLDAEVLGGFADHVARIAPALPWRARCSTRWAKILLTARLARRGAEGGALSYVLVSGRRGPA